jgi:hypothetical protein
MWIFSVPGQMLSWYPNWYQIPRCTDCFSCNPPHVNINISPYAALWFNVSVLKGLETSCRDEQRSYVIFLKVAGRKLVKYILVRYKKMYADRCLFFLLKHCTPYFLLQSNYLHLSSAAALIKCNCTYQVQLHFAQRFALRPAQVFQTIYRGALYSSCYDVTVESSHSIISSNFNVPFGFLFQIHLYIYHFQRQLFEGRTFIVSSVFRHPWVVTQTRRWSPQGMLAEVMFVTIQRENIRPSKKETNKAVTMLNLPDVCS